MDLLPHGFLAVFSFLLASFDDFHATGFTVEHSAGFAGSSDSKLGLCELGLRVYLSAVVLLMMLVSREMKVCL